MATKWFASYPPNLFDKGVQRDELPLQNVQRLSVCLYPSKYRLLFLNSIGRFGMELIKATFTFSSRFSRQPSSLVVYLIPLPGWIGKRPIFPFPIRSRQQAYKKD